MNTLKINIEEIPNQEVREVVRIIDSVANELSIDFYLIGARARDFWFESLSLTPRRFTLDIDFAVLVPDEEIFGKFKSLLIEENGFEATKENPHRLIYTYKDIVVDLLPFGEIANSGYISFNDKSSTIISVIGFKEVYEQLLNDGFVEGEVKIASLAGLCLLKLIAWDDRKNEREKDIVDFSIIVKYYFDFIQTEFYDDYLDLITEDFDTIKAGGRVLGRHINKIIRNNSKLINRINRILSENVDDINNSKIGVIISQQLGIDVETAISIINEIMAGLNE
jgi:predicted nucleotidyltransferase